VRNTSSEDVVSSGGGGCTIERLADSKVTGVTFVTSPYDAKAPTVQRQYGAPGVTSPKQ
jgi:hypothetical protein